ncbi:hypothetical protein SAVERM_374 [Streptomyces avermitilis MA-4680 = NBRC 14893]|uniref:Uncharacterized protein n=1 Tax=Streptomyces avermitilis (strain ATCC 31267 / DSM 46492 / JCM 5070 / NBRC 14893 / NCIMB 12804 / NRRL 8165 / MA-4680) TaxID=227882 RepID=Q82QX1_STRAW|nr:hypothetical protein SAVERM_374 [Streptomyces avermitilis MA-4680 = NBRC 14893]
MRPVRQRRADTGFSAETRSVPSGGIEWPRSRKTPTALSAHTTGPARPKWVPSIATTSIPAQRAPAVRTAEAGPRRRSNRARTGRTPSRVRASHNAVPLIVTTSIESSAAVSLRQTAR